MGCPTPTPQCQLLFLHILYEQGGEHSMPKTQWQGVDLEQRADGHI